MSYIRGDHSGSAAFQVIAPSTLCHLIEREVPGAIACVMEFDADAAVLRLVFGESLPFALRNRMRRVPVGEHHGVSSAAAYWRRTIITTDIARDPRWEGFRRLARAAGVRSSVATPVVTTDDGLLGVLTVLLEHHDGPRQRDTDLIQTVVTVLPAALRHPQR